jgi:thioredoxin-like negative regulator of GroEL
MRFNPKYLQVQNLIDQTDFRSKGFQMAKIDCSIDNESFCLQTFNVDSYPTVLIFVDGKLKHEYPFEDEVEPLMRYIKELVIRNPLRPSLTTKIENQRPILSSDDQQFVAIDNTQDQMLIANSNVIIFPIMVLVLVAAIFYNRRKKKYY